MKGDPLGALRLVALRDDAPALALRGVAMAQLGDLARAKDLLRRATRAFGPREVLARARCQLAFAEVSLAARDLGPTVERALITAARGLEKRGDGVNARYAEILLVRRSILLGRVDRAVEALGRMDARPLPAALVAITELARADVALRRVRVAEARSALDFALVAAQRAGVPALVAEVARALERFDAPAARSIRSGDVRQLRLDEVEAVLSSRDLVIDAHRRVVRDGHGDDVALARRPILFALARALAAAWPHDVPRGDLIVEAFGARRHNESHRARLRVEIGRLRKVLRAHASIDATASGFVLAPRRAPAVTVLAPPFDGEGAAIVALLADGEAWSTSALALALGRSQRSVQRELSVLAADSAVRPLGLARSRRWLAAPVTGFTTALLLPVVPLAS